MEARKRTSSFDGLPAKQQFTKIDQNWTTTIQHRYSTLQARVIDHLSRVLPRDSIAKAEIESYDSIFSRTDVVMYSMEYELPLKDVSVFVRDIYDNYVDMSKPALKTEQKGDFLRTTFINRTFTTKGPNTELTEAEMKAKLGDWEEYDEFLWRTYRSRVKILNFKKKWLPAVSLNRVGVFKKEVFSTLTVDHVFILWQRIIFRKLVPSQKISATSIVFNYLGKFLKLLQLKMIESNYFDCDKSNKIIDLALLSMEMNIFAISQLFDDGNGNLDGMIYGRVLKSGVYSTLLEFYNLNQYPELKNFAFVGLKRFYEAKHGLLSQNERIKSSNFQEFSLALINDIQTARKAQDSLQNTTKMTKKALTLKKMGSLVSEEQSKDDFKGLRVSFKAQLQESESVDAFKMLDDVIEPKNQREFDREHIFSHYDHKVRTRLEKMKYNRRYTIIQEEFDKIHKIGDEPLYETPPLLIIPKEIREGTFWGDYPPREGIPPSKRRCSEPKRIADPESVGGIILIDDVEEYPFKKAQPKPKAGLSVLASLKQKQMKKKKAMQLLTSKQKQTRGLGFPLSKR
ncbi:hypothetical protein PCE1_002283 [Barthelona sp. PCE]